MSEDKVIVLFRNIRQVILAEEWCMDNNLNVKVIPVPKPYSSECGMCLVVTREDGAKLERFANGNGMIARIFPWDR